ncbi:MAG TPA: TIGR04255 family protein [Terriglobia bacterium]|nr:TIGR04255 family protein [Terriglobia bacterium]
MEIKPELLDKVFPNAPVKEVAYEIRFAPLLRVQRDLADFQGQIVSDYPTYTTEPIMLDTDRVQGWRFSSDDRGRTVRVTERSFGFITNRYVSFEQYKSELLRLQDAFAKVFDIQAIKRVGLRYVNNIMVQFGQGQPLFLQYVNPVIDLTRLKEAEIVRFACEVQLKRARGVLMMRTGLIEVPPGGSGKPEEQAVYILDLDFQNEGPLVLPGSKLLDDFHDEIQKEFLAHLKDTYLPIMETSK